MQQTGKNPVLRKLRVANLQPRTINPNKMTAKAFAAYKKEVKRLGRPPKPIIVRPRGGGKFEIVDGEHAWRCSKELGMTEVLCEVRDLDNFDAGRECYNRNRGGTDNPLVLARLFQDMMSQRELPQRAFAREMNISEGTVRNKLEYLDAFKLRKEYAPDTAKEDIARLKQSQVRFYKRQPSSLGNPWLDSGADLTAFDGVYDWTRDRVTYEIHRRKLSSFLDASPNKFCESVRRLAQLAMWLDQHEHVQDAQAYALTAAELGVPSDALELLPLGGDERQTRVLIPVSAWKDLLAKAQKQAGRRSGMFAAIEAGIRLALRDAGINPEDVRPPAEVEALRIVAQAPDFIQSADHLTLDEKRWLAELPVDDDEELIRSAQQMTCELLHESRGPKRRRRKVHVQSDSIEVVFDWCMRELVQQRKTAEVEDFFKATDELVQAVVERLSDTRAIKEGLVHGQSAAEVLEERIEALDWPEFYLLAPHVLKGESLDMATRLWLKAMQQDSPTPGIEV